MDKDLFEAFIVEQHQEFLKRVPESEKYLYCNHGYYKGAVPGLIPKDCGRCIDAQQDGSSSETADSSGTIASVPGRDRHGARTDD